MNEGPFRNKALINREILPTNQILFTAKQVTNKVKKINLKKTKLYPVAKPFKVLMLPVSKLHNIHVAEFGNPEGYPVVVLHGGPGHFSSDKYRLFDPDFYRIIQIDQRGAGESKPPAELRENTTQDLVEDIEKVRKKLNVAQWLVYGGSWGSTLGLLYGETYSEKVSGMIIHGIWLARDEDTAHYFQDGFEGKGLGATFPEAWKEYEFPIPLEKRKNLISAYYDLATSPDLTEQKTVGRIFWEFVFNVCNMKPSNTPIKWDDKKQERAVALVRIVFHYAMNHSFLEKNQVLKNTDKIREAKIPLWAFNGRYDQITPLSAFSELKNQFMPTDDAHFKVVENSSHAIKTPMRQELMEAIREFQKRVETSQI